jgi:hypothetical protein
VLGYSKMERSISYRCKRRLPTHMAVDLGPTLSFERLIQTLGRCTGRHVPRGHSVTVLSNGLDYDASRAYIRFQNKLIELMKADPTKTVYDIVDTHTFADTESFWAFNRRTVAQKRAKRSSWFTINREPFDLYGPHREGFRTAFDTVTQSYWYMEELFRIFQEYPSDMLTLSVLMEKVKEKLAENARKQDEDEEPCSETLLNSSLMALVKAKFVVKGSGGSKKWMWNDVDGRDE